MVERKKLLLRLQPAVYDEVARWAADELRSVNAQIEYALRLAMRSAGRRVPDPDAPNPRGTDPGATDTVGTWVGDESVGPDA